MPNPHDSFAAAMTSQWLDVAIAFGAGVVSGTAAFLHQFRRNQPRLFSLVDFCADTLLSGVTAVLAFAACMWFSETYYKLSWWAVAFIVGIVAHKSARWLYRADRWLVNNTPLGDDRDPP